MFLTKDELLHFLLIPLIIGLLGGFSALLFRDFIDFFHFLFQKINFLHGDIFYLISTPIIFVLSNLLVLKFLLHSEGVSLDNIAKKIALLHGHFSPVKGSLVLFLTSLNIGFGLPVGREAPIAKLGGLLGELFLKLIKVPRVNLILYLSAAVSSAIAATFNAPLAGVLLGIEIILGKVNLYLLIPLIVASTTATLLAREFLGNYTAFFVPHLQFKELYFYLVPFVGIFFGFLALLTKLSINFIRGLKLSLRHLWLKIVFINGLVVGSLLSLFPQIRGTGYSYITGLFLHKTSPLEAFFIMLLKWVAVVITLGSGLFGGLMSPSIFIGAFGGYALGSIFTFLGADPRVFILVGSAAMLAGISRAPLRTSIIVVELTHSYQLLLPILIASSISAFISAKFEPGAYFKRSLIQKGIDIENSQVLEFLKCLDPRKYLTFISPLKEDDDYSQALKLFAKVHTRYLPVVNEKGKLVGILSATDLLKILQRGTEVKISQIMHRNPIFLKEGFDKEELVKILGMFTTSSIPYLDKDGKYIGMLDLNRLLKDLTLVNSSCQSDKLQHQ